MNVVIIVPCYNEEARLKTKLFLEFVSLHQNITTIFVNDGSTDNTLHILKQLAQQNERIQVLDLERNMGKAEAIRRGFQLSLDKKTKWDLIGYLDADLASPLSNIQDFIAVFKKGLGLKLIMGIRLQRLGANIKRQLLRHYLGRVFATCASLVLGLAVYDTQCGTKFLTPDLVQQVIKREFKSKWFFDLEILYICFLAYGKSSIFELPLLEWHDIKGSKLKTSDFLWAPFELLKLKFYFEKLKHGFKRN